MVDEFRADENRPQHRGSRVQLDPSRCKAGVWSNERWSRYSQCARKAGVDGWCKQHHPEAEAERERASNAKYAQSMRRDAMGWYGERFMAALVKIRDGDNDPRETARLALAHCKYAEEQIAPVQTDVKIEE